MKGKPVKTQAREALGYNEKRPGKDQEKIERNLFGHGGQLTGEQALKMIDEASRNTYFWRLILSPDPNGENKDKQANLWKLTKQLVEWLEAKLQREIPFVAVEHNDHTNIAHVHAILLIERHGREMLITKEMIDHMREMAAGQALAQQRAKAQALEMIPRVDRMQEGTQASRRDTPAYEQRPLIGAAG